MIIGTKEDNIFNTEAKHIAFAINKEGINDSGFAGQVLEYTDWKELENLGECEIGSIISHEYNGKTYHGLVSHSLHEDWGENQDRLFQECFDKIDTDEEIATIAIGTGLVGVLSGAHFKDILYGMYTSKKNIILYGRYDYLEVKRYCEERLLEEEKENEKNLTLGLNKK